MIDTSFVQTSFSTFLMAIITTNIFLILLSVCLVNSKLLTRAGHRLLALFVLFTTLRFIFPIELPFTVTIKLPAIISQLIANCHNRLFLICGQPISFISIFKFAWVGGFILGLVKLIITYYRSSKMIVLYGKELTNTQPYQKLIAQICTEKGRANRFRIIELPGLNTPALFGIIHPRILIPEGFQIAEQDLTYILQHEAAHHFNHDILLKNIIKVITLFYWWDIFSWILNRQAEVILEMRIDNRITTDKTTTEEYMHCLIHISELAVQKSILPRSITLGVLPKGYQDLKRRFMLMINNQKKNNPMWTIILLLISVSIYLFSYMVVFEAYKAPEEIVPNVYGDFMFPSSDNSYFIANEDGTYDYYMNGARLETVDSLQYYPDDIPVYTRDNAPQ